MDGSFLQHRRIDLGLSQAKVAESLGYSTQTISLWEKGKGSPSLPIWGKLASLYELDLEGLLLDQDKKESSLCAEMEFSAERFAASLRRLRKKEGLTQAELGAQLGVPANAILRFEQGASFPSDSQFKKLAEIFSLRYEELYFSLPSSLPSVAPKAKQPKKKTILLVLLAVFVVVGGGGAAGIVAALRNRNTPAPSFSSAYSSEPSLPASSSGPSSSPTEYSSSAQSPSEETSSSLSDETSSAEATSSLGSSSSAETSSLEDSTSSESSSALEESSLSETSSLGDSSESSSVSSASEEAPISVESSSTPFIPHYTVDFDLDGGVSPSYQGPVEAESLDGIFFFDVTKEDFDFRGWLYLGELIYDEKGIKQKEVTLTDGMVFVAKWEAIAYPVYYVLDGGTNNAGNPSSVTAMDTFTLLAPSKAGYLFSSWYVDEKMTTAILTLKGSDVKAKGSITLYAKFTYNALDPYNYPYLSFTKLPGNKASVKSSGTPSTGEKLLIPDQVTLDGVTCTVSRIEPEGFKGLSSFLGITLPAHLESIGANAFENCYSLSSLSLLSEESLSVEKEAFASCPNLRFVKLGTCLSSVGTDAFKSCDDELVFLFEAGYDDTLGRAWNPDHRPIVPFGAAFAYVQVGGVKYMKVAVASTEAYCAFGATSSTASIAAEVYGTPVWMIGENAFYGNSSLTSVTLPSGLMIVSSYAFAYCTGLSSIYIPDSVDTIMDYAFLGASSLFISCEASSKPDGWSSLWNPSSRPVAWNK